MGRWSEEDKRNVFALLEDDFSYREIRDMMGVPLATINRWVANPACVLGSGNTCVLSCAQETLLVKACCYAADCGFPLGRERLSYIVQTFVKDTGKNTPFSDGLPGVKWFQNFEKRHLSHIKRRKKEGLSKKRIVALTKRNLRVFYNQTYKPVYDRAKLDQRPFCLWNCDETIFQPSRAKEKVYCRATCRNAYAREPNSTRQGFSVLFCGNAAGQMMPPFVVYKAKHLRLSWCTEGLDDATYSVSDSGWMMDTNFESWIEHTFIPYVKEVCPGNTHVLIFDGHNSHLTYRTIKLAIDNDIIIICLPPNTSHALQPLDVGVFKALKALFSKIINDWNFRTGGNKNIDKEVFPILLKQLYDGIDPSWIISGFRKTGLYKFNKNAVDYKIVLNPEELVVSDPPRSDGAAVARAVQKGLESQMSDDLTKKLANKAVQRRRVQHISGEVLTEPAAMQRLKEHDELKKARGRGRGRGGVARGKQLDPQAGALNKFVVRRRRRGYGKGKGKVK